VGLGLEGACRGGRAVLAVGMGGLGSPATCLLAVTGVVAGLGGDLVEPIFAAGASLVAVTFLSVSGRGAFGGCFRGLGPAELADGGFFGEGTV